METITLNVYEDDMKTVKKECVAVPTKIPFGVIRKLMKLFNENTLEDTSQILTVVTGSFDDTTQILHNAFPEIEEEEWDNVDVTELVAVIYKIIKHSFLKMLEIPVGKK
ncbi:MAG: hypothetical protein K2N51_15735 [Lachnospiraceae bacterium]|nr:hypothetical protein [Lachnospiraceae bacterium]